MPFLGEQPYQTIISNLPVHAHAVDVPAQNWEGALLEADRP